MVNLILYSNDIYYKQVLHYIYSHYTDKINDFVYSSTNITKTYEWRERFNENKVKVCHPYDSEMELDFNDTKIIFTLKSLVDSNNIPKKINIPHGCSTTEEVILKKLTLTSETKEMLIKFIDTAKEFCEKQMKDAKKSEKHTININYWRKEYWTLLFKCPKRPIETLYLKEGVKEKMIEQIQDFFSKETRDEYIRYGIPYKNVFLLYGVPGSGKTSTIRTIASYLDCNLYIIPISKELTDYGLIDALTYIEEKEEKKRMIIIEDIDCIFTERKKGDSDNGISLQGLLNCFDGFSCVEGTLLFLTANKPEVLDQAMIRSCRIDHRYKLGYADEYQTKCIFETIMHNYKEKFNEFYDKISTKKYTTAMLQEFLFDNRKNPDYMKHIKEFYEIIEKNKPSNYTEKEEQQLYM